MDFSADCGRRTAIATQVVAIAVLVIVVIAGVAAYAVLSSGGSKSTSTGTSTTTGLSTSTSTSSSSSSSQPSSISSSASSSTLTTTSLNGNYTTATLSPITFGMLTEFTGPVYGSLGNSNWILSNLAAKEINDSGGILGHPIKFIKYDDQDNTQTALEGMSVLDQQDNVLAITGPTDTNVALAVKGYAEQNHVPLVISVAASPELTVPGTQWTFRLELNSVGAGATTGKYLANTNPGSKVALIYTNLGYPQQTVAGLKYILQTYTNDSESIVYNQQFPVTTSDFSTAAASIKLSGANIVVTDVLSNGGNLYQALNAAGYNNTQIFNAASPPASESASGPNASGIIGSTMYDANIAANYPAAVALDNKMIPLLNACTICLNGAKQINPSFTDLYEYETVYLMAQAVYIMLHSGQPLTRTNFVAAMHQVKSTDVLGQPISFDANGAGVGGAYFVEQAGALDPTTQIYGGKVLASYTWGPGLPVYNITASASGT
jgi:branched-chain amino acid transport system substrate-binding protein